MNQRGWFLPCGIVIGGVLLLAGVGVMLSAPANATAELPQGWQIIRPPHDVHTLTVEEDIVWAGGRDGVYRLDRISGDLLLELECDVHLEHVRDLLVDRSGVLLIAHMAGLSSFDGNSCYTLTKEDGLPDNRVNALMLDRDGRLWVGTWGGAAINEDGVWSVIASADGLADDMVNVMLQDSQGGMWFGSYVAPRGGISTLKDSKWQHFTTEDRLPHPNVTSLLEGPDGTIWAGTGLLDRGGAAQFVRTPTGWEIQKTIKREDGLAGEKVRSIYVDNDGVYWFGSEYDGLTRVEYDHWIVLTEQDGLSNPEIKDMIQDQDGMLWIGTRDGVTRLSADALEVLRRQNDELQ